MKDTAVNIIKKLKRYKFTAYFAGGCVRDILMDRKPHDYDIATNARPEDIEKIFDKTIPVGKQFGVMLVIEDGHQFEIATFRYESGYSDGRRPDAILFSDPREDAKRRDFTINGMFYDPLKEHVIDYVNGRRDLKERLINFIGNPEKRIQEDHLRILRAVRFAHKINGQYHPKTYKALKENAHLIQDVSKERIQDEMNKILLNKDRTNTLEDLYQLGILEHIIPELIETRGIAQPYMYHQEGSVWKHIMRALRSLRHKPSLLLVWSVLLHDVGKPRTFDIDSRIRFNDHARVSSNMARRILTRLKFPKQFINDACWLITHHMSTGNVLKMQRPNQVKWITHPLFNKLVALLKADGSGSVPVELNMYHEIRSLQKEVKRSLPKKIPKLISGDVLMKRFTLSPGKEIGKLLKKVEEKQLKGDIHTKKQALDFVDRLIKKQ